MAIETNETELTTSVLYASDALRDLRSRFPQISRDAKARIVGVVTPCKNVSNCCWLVEENGMLYIKDEDDQRIFSNPDNGQLEIFIPDPHLSYFAGGREMFIGSENFNVLAIRM